MNSLPFVEYTILRSSRRDSRSGVYVSSMGRVGRSVVGLVRSLERVG